MENVCKFLGLRPEHPCCQADRVPVLRRQPDGVHPDENRKKVKKIEVKLLFSII
jgi:hypothetical protein